MLCAGQSGGSSALWPPTKARALPPSLVGGDQCTSCRENTFSSEQAVECVQCPTNSTSSIQSISIQNCSCDPGFYRVLTNGNYECKKCSVGRYKNYSGNDACDFCENGFIAPYTGAIVCLCCGCGHNTNPNLCCAHNHRGGW